MDFKKFYCHKCGGLLLKSPKTRKIRPGDTDYNKYRAFGHTFYSGDLELTQYDFRCSKCHNIITFKEQTVLNEIQKSIEKKILTKDEIADNIESATEKVNKRDKRNYLIWTAVFIILAVIIFYLMFESGNFEFKFYL